jgi:hypothetical protein
MPYFPSLSLNRARRQCVSLQPSGGNNGLVWSGTRRRVDWVAFRRGWIDMRLPVSLPFLVEGETGNSMGLILEARGSLFFESVAYGKVVKCSLFRCSCLSAAFHGSPVAGARLLHVFPPILVRVMMFNYLSQAQRFPTSVRALEDQLFYI